MILVFGALLLIWEALVRALDIKPVLLPPPSLVLAELAENFGWYLEHAAWTLLQTMLGFLLAVVLGLVIAIGIAFSRIVEKILYTLLVAINAVPKIAVAPLFVIWLGTGIEPKVAIAFLIAVFPIVIDAVLGLKSTDPDMLDLARVLKGDRLQVLRKIQFPNALPSIFAGLKVGISFAFIGAIVGEFIASTEGLGYIIMTSQGTYDTTRIFAAILFLSIIGACLFYLIEALEKSAIPWHVSQRNKLRVLQI
jgi:NitT/TauT family transport system permease protein